MCFTHIYIFLSLDYTRTGNDAEWGGFLVCHFHLSVNWVFCFGLFLTLLVLILAGHTQTLFVCKKNFKTYKCLIIVSANFSAESSSPVFELREEKNTFFIQQITYVIFISYKQKQRKFYLEVFFEVLSCLQPIAFLFHIF